MDCWWIYDAYRIEKTIHQPTMILIEKKFISRKGLNETFGAGKKTSHRINRFEVCRHHDVIDFEPSFKESFQYPLFNKFSSHA